MKKKILSIILSVVTVVSALSVGSMTAFAGGWVSSAYNVNLNTTYSESVDSTDAYDYDGGYYFDVVKFTLPAKGKINIKLTSEDTNIVKYMDSGDCRMNIYKTSNTERYLWSSDSNRISDGYNAGLGYYYGNYSATLPKGTYYLVFTFGDYYENNSYDFKLTYTPSFSRTSIRKTSTPKKGQIRVDWDKCANVSGYQVQYSRNKNMKNAKRITAKGSNNYSRTIKNLSSKKKYYVRVRTYKTVKVNGKNKTYYSKWSSKKSVTTR